jgi:hypothetical protein
MLTTIVTLIGLLALRVAVPLAVTALLCIVLRRLVRATE